MPPAHARLTSQHQHAIRDVTQAYEQASVALANAAQVEQDWLERITQPEPERLSFWERLDRCLLGEPGTGSLYDDLDGLTRFLR